MTSLIPEMILPSKYQIVQCLGEGTFGSVSAAIKKDSGQKVAIKQIYIQKHFLEEAEPEISMLMKLKGNHIVKIIQSFYDPQEFSLNVVLELCQSTLRSQIQNHTFYDQATLISFLVQISSAFLQLQSMKVMHLDFKPENILLLDQEGRYFKICDFGCAQISNLSKLSGYEKSAFGTFNYLAPEIFLNYQGKKSRSSADIWALGVTLYEMIFWKLPFPKTSNQHEFIDRTLLEKYFKKQQVTIDYSASEEAPHKVIDLIKLMLAPDPLERITWDKLKAHLIKEFKVQQHEFMRIEHLISNFVPITKLYLNVLNILAQYIKEGKHAFWKQNSRLLTELRESLLRYLYIICDDVGDAFQIKSAKLEKSLIAAADKLFQQVLQERKKCGDKIKSFQKKDLGYREMELMGRLKDCIQALESFQKTMDYPMKLLNSFSRELYAVVNQDRGLFTTISSFSKSFSF